jgi:excinuclease ABC subunit C
MGFDQEEISRFPQEPGVYLMKDPAGEVLYVGKANNLRQRVRQYFNGHDKREMIPYLIERVATIETIVVSSETEALLLENTLIKQHWPRYNALLKDDKTFYSLRLSRHTWPSLELVRLKGPAADSSKYFGPFPSAWAARNTFELIQQLFPLRRCSDRELASRIRPCILYDMHKCLAPCVNRCSPQEYSQLVDQVERFLKGQQGEVVKELKTQMEAASEALEFERAQELYRTLRSIEQIAQEQHVDQARGADTDVWGLLREGDRVAIAQLFFRHGKLTGAHQHVFEGMLEDDEELVSSLLLQLYGNNCPAVIVTPVELTHKEQLREILSGLRGKAVEIVHPKRGDRLSLLEMANRNAAATFQRTYEAQERREKMLDELMAAVDLERYPERIEIIDTSHLAGTEGVSVVVTYVDGEKSTEHYRKYLLRDTLPGDDYGALREVLRRRFRKGTESDLPELIVIDGGKVHLDTALQVLEELGLAAVVDVVAIAKEEGRHDKGLSKEVVWQRHHEHALRLPVHHAALLFLQQMRDEAHRFAIQFQRSRRRTSTIKTSLDAIPGIGPTKRKALLRHFGSAARVKQAGPEEWSACPGLNRRDLLALAEWKKGSSSVLEPQDKPEESDEKENENHGERNDHQLE